MTSVMQITIYYIDSLDTSNSDRTSIIYSWKSGVIRGIDKQEYGGYTMCV